MACFDANVQCQRIWNMPKACPYAMALSFWDTTSFKKSCYHQGFFAVKRRAVFILGATWIALVRGWRRDCVVGGMETRFQRRKAHSRTAKCEAFHIAPRLFFYDFVFGSIHDLATMNNLSPGIFHWTIKILNLVKIKNWQHSRWWECCHYFLWF